MTSPTSSSQKNNKTSLKNILIKSIDDVKIFQKMKMINGIKEGAYNKSKKYMYLFPIKKIDKWKTPRQNLLTLKMKKKY